MYKLNYERKEVVIENKCYKLEKIGSGGNAHVFKIRGYTSDVVIKILKADCSENDKKDLKEKLLF